MLFNSQAFLLIFLPITVVVYFLLKKTGVRSLPVVWLVAASLFFYGWWNPAYLGLILGSIVVNYSVGNAIESTQMAARRRVLTFAGVSFNLALLGYFKYAGFFAETLSALTGLALDVGQIALPLAISFFTFQQIAYLMDASRGEVRERRFLHYCLFVTFFPQLIAGPIVHHKEMMPQFAEQEHKGFSIQNLAIGLSLLSLGLAKKVLLADGIAEHSTPVFDLAHSGAMITTAAAWGGALGYTLQIYFDFSAYSDMAIGLARIFGVVLPLNFDSPYKAINMIDYWRRWHMTLSRFLRDYLFFQLGGFRRGTTRLYLHLFITMFLGGLWHGAAWTIVVWGTLHGVYLMINHGWHAWKKRLGLGGFLPPPLARGLARGITFLALVLAFVVFRSESLATAGQILLAMLGNPGLPQASELVAAGFGPMGFSWIAVLLAIAFFAPNSQEIMHRASPALIMPRRPIPRLVGRLAWQPSIPWALVTLSLFCASLYRITVDGYAEFIYRFF